MLFSTLFQTHSYAISPKILLLHRDEAVQAFIPIRPLAEGSIRVSLAAWQQKDFVKWSPEERAQTWNCLQRIVYAWKSMKPVVYDFLIYGKVSSSSGFSWEIVPYPKRTWAIWRQLRVLWHIAFGAPRAGERTREQVAKTVVRALSSLESCLLNRVHQVVIGRDPFCRQDVLDRQTVFEGKEIRVLYNFAPIRLGGQELHFLLVPIAHRSRFDEVTQSEYLECQDLASQIVQFYQARGYPTAYLFDKTGKRAGQTVPHWHQHLVFTATQMDDWKGKWDVFYRMLFGASPLKPQELARRVSAIKSDLQYVLIQPSA